MPDIVSNPSLTEEHQSVPEMADGDKITHESETTFTNVCTTSSQIQQQKRSVKFPKNPIFDIATFDAEIFNTGVMKINIFEHDDEDGFIRIHGPPRAKRPLHGILKKAQLHECCNESLKSSRIPSRVARIKRIGHITSKVVFYPEFPPITLNMLCTDRLSTGLKVFSNQFETTDKSETTLRSCIKYRQKPIRFIVDPLGETFDREAQDVSDTEDRAVTAFSGRFVAGENPSRQQPNQQMTAVDIGTPTQPEGQQASAEPGQGRKTLKTRCLRMWNWCKNRLGIQNTVGTIIVNTRSQV
jgi:hypothetical protein